MTTTLNRLLDVVYVISCRPGSSVAVLQIFWLDVRLSRIPISCALLMHLVARFLAEAATLKEPKR